MTQVNEDRYYDEMFERYNEDSTVSLEDYNQMKEIAATRLAQLQDVLEFIRNNDCAGAFEYLVSEGIVWATG